MGSCLRDLYFLSGKDRSETKFRTKFFCLLFFQEKEESEAIFSCFTLWSITWREASSALISSRVIPEATISTITW